MTHDMSARSKAEGHFREARAAKTASTSKQINNEREKADSAKSARLKAARLANAKDDAGEKE